MCLFDSPVEKQPQWTRAKRAPPVLNREKLSLILISLPQELSISHPRFQCLHEANM